MDMIRSRPGAHRTAALALAAAVFVIDQAAKLALVGPLDIRRVGSIALLPFFSFTYVENHGISMGFLRADGQTGRWLLVAATAIIAAAVTRWLWRERSRADALAQGAVLGGAIGNIVDRVRLGYVIDYADLHVGEWRPFLVFNLADAAITIGVLLLVLRALLTPQGSKKAEAS